MKVLCCADLHISNKKPKFRKGDYLKQCLDKFEFILKIASDTHAVIVVAGDFFDSATVPYAVTEAVCSLIVQYKRPILMVPGQHDVHFHNLDMSNTPMGILLSTLLMIRVQPHTSYFHEGITFRGAGWGEESKHPAENPTDFLIMHKMVVNKEPLFEGQTDYIEASKLMKEYSWARCIITGDNHKPHIVETKKSLHINCGSMMRSSRSQTEHTPAIYLVDTRTWNFETIHIPVLPVEEVFDLKKIEHAKQVEEIKENAAQKVEEIQKFIASLSTSQEDQPDFHTILSQIIIQQKPVQQVKDLLVKLMGDLPA